MNRKLYNLLLEVWLPVVLVALWWYLSENSSSPFFPPLREILQVFNDTWIFERFGTDVVPSLKRFLEGFAIAVILGVSIGVLLGMTPLARKATAPTIDFLRSIPAVALVSVFIVMLGFGDLAKVTAIAFAAFFPILLNTIDGVRGVDPVQLDLARRVQDPLASEDREDHPPRREPADLRRAEDQPGGGTARDGVQ